MTQHHDYRATRRGFLQGGIAAGGAALLGGPLGASSLFRSVASGDHTLVVLQLAGGNDGLNTIVPFQDDVYLSSRKYTGIDPKKVLPLDDYRGFNPLLGGMRDLHERGELAIIEGVGYGPPDRSHFSSFDIWHTASLQGKAAGDGWLAKLAAQLRTGGEADTNLAVHIGDRAPYSLFSRTASTVCFDDPEMYRFNDNEGLICDAAMIPATGAKAGSSVDRVRTTFLQARESSAAIRDAAREYVPRVEYPDSRLGYAMKVCAGLIQKEVGARILSVELAGFDTHARQVGRHDYLISTFDSALAAFCSDLRGTAAGGRTTVLVFSEFGRRVADNASEGTDHGTAGPSFVIGPKVNGGLHGKHPSLEDLDDGDLKYTTDFRSMYATLIRDWFGADDKAVLGAEYPTLPLFA